jgi:hypothetical protein
MDLAMREPELQQELARFTTRFSDRVTQAADALESSPSACIRDEALRSHLLYVSSAIEIAAGPIPGIALLDMIVFIRLCRSVLERHWLPCLYGHEGDALADVFARSDSELADIAAQALEPEQRDHLAGIISAWLADNPQQLRVEGVRLADFSAAAGSHAAARAGQARGLLSSVKTATQTASHAMLLGERALFLVHRLPAIWRLQARLGAREITRDMVVQVTQAPRIHHLTQRMRRGAVYAAVGSGVALLAWRLTGRARSRR